jgi:hypothetical protein
MFLGSASGSPGPPSGKGEPEGGANLWGKSPPDRAAGDSENPQCEKISEIGGTNVATQAG